MFLLPVPSVLNTYLSVFPVSLLESLASDDVLFAGLNCQEQPPVELAQTHVVSVHLLWVYTLDVALDEVQSLVTR